MTSNAQRVQEFHLAVGVECPPRPTVPAPHVLQLRRTLISEEYAEVLDAFAALEATPTQRAGDGLAALAQELADLLYVTYGALGALGVDADAVFAEVHRANLSKASGPKRPDGKQLKPEGWQPANVRGVLERLARE